MTGKIKKILRMSPAEIRFRAWEQIRIRYEKQNARRELETVEKPDFNFFVKTCDFELYTGADPTGLWRKEGFARRLCEPLTEERKQAFINNYPERYSLALKRADAFMENRFAFLGVAFTLPDPIPWQKDPLSLNPYPDGFYRDIDIFTNKNAGDIKHVWEVNRLQYLIELTKAAWLSGERKYAEKFESLLTDWIRTNPYKRGVAWASALEVGVRVSALVWALAFYRACPFHRPDVLRAMLKLIYLSGAYLYENLSIYFSPYNHLIGEAAGLFLAGYLFPGFRDADKWANRAWDVLCDQVEKQFHADGGSVEQASFYHHFTLGFYLQTIQVKRLNGQEVPARVMERVRRAIEFSACLTKPDGDMPHLGDIDDARSIYFGDPTHWDFSAWRAIGAAWYGRGAFKYGLKQLPEEAYWLLSNPDQENYARLKAIPPDQNALLLKESGYAFFRNGFGEDAHFCMMDCGPIAHGVFHDDTPSAAHGHADELAIELSAFGESFLVDPGFSNYRGDFDWHCYFRSTAAHNTVEINGQSQAKQGGILQWSRAPRFKQLEFVDHESAKAFCGEHYGYQQQPGAPVHRRYLLFVDNLFWVVADYIYPAKGKGEQTDFKEHFHFNAGLKTAIEEGKQSIVCQGDKATLSIHTLSQTPSPLHFRFTEGADGADGGWISPTYRAVRPAPLVSMAYQAVPPLCVVKVLYPQKKGQTGPEFQKENQQLMFGDYTVIMEEASGDVRVEAGGKHFRICHDGKDGYIHLND
ncbi:MAG: hypothetical protein D6677_14265 [Calditrichaeota bacterium]|nr:MAG: hypothetical protein D6677_14265 [Calditrichota bacterium]